MPKSIVPNSSRIASILICCSLLLLAAIGCYNDDQIRSYTVDPVADIEPANDTEGKPQRMLATIMLPGGDAWFFKLTGPIEAVDQLEGEVRDLVESVTFGPGGKPQWEAPDSWDTGRTNDIRYATLLIPQEKADPLELSVTSLPHAASDTYVLDNVNRWRGQLSQAKLTAAELDDQIESFEVAGVPTTWVDITGTASEGGMRPPFMAGGAGTPPMADALAEKSQATQGPATDDAAEEEATQPESTAPQTAGPEPLVGPQPVGGTSTGEETTSGGIAFKKPATWTQKQGSAFRKLAFDVSGGSGGKNEVTVIQLGPQPGSLLDNINRWRGQVGLEPLAEDQLDNALNEVPVGEEQGQLAEIIGPQQGILGTIVSRPDSTWFVKFQGDAALAKAERDNFEAFLKSLKLK